MRLASLSGLRIRRCCELRYRSAAVALIRFLAWESTYAAGVALKKTERTKRKKRSRFTDIENKLVVTSGRVPYRGGGTGSTSYQTYCTTQGLEPIPRNNCKGSINFQNCIKKKKKQVMRGSFSFIKSLFPF